MQNTSVDCTPIQEMDGWMISLLSAVTVKCMFSADGVSQLRDTQCNLLSGEGECIKTEI